jgi:HCOMODA/2-hydroxy-3-carboxy-muconic semialdehyde decarboxylase
LPHANYVPRQADGPDQAIIDDLVYANRILSYKGLGILDALGHVSVRDPRNPNHYFIARYVSAAFVTANDIIENDLDSKPVAGPRSDQFQEIYMHGEIYKARPDVMAIVHAHTPEIVVFTESSVTMCPVINGGMFMGERLPIHDVRKFDPREILIRTPELGRSVAIVLANRPAVLLKGHGYALTGSSLQGVVARAYQLRMNAKVQQQAIALGGKVTYLEQPEEAPLPVRTAVPAKSSSDVQDDRAWEYWKQLVVAK